MLGKFPTFSQVSHWIPLHCERPVIQWCNVTVLNGSISHPNDVPPKNLFLTFHHFSDLSHSYRFVTSPGCWLRLSTHVTTMSSHESKSSTQVVMETTSNLWALTFDLWQVERLSLEQFGQGWWAAITSSPLLAKILWFCGGYVLDGIDESTCEVWGTCARMDATGLSLSHKTKHTERWFCIANNQAPVWKFQKMQKLPRKNKMLIIQTSHKDYKNKTNLT